MWLRRRAGGTTDSCEMAHFKHSCELAYFEIGIACVLELGLDNSFRICVFGAAACNDTFGCASLSDAGRECIGEGSGQGFSRNGLPSSRAARVRRFDYVSTRTRVTDSLERYEGRMDQ